MIKSSMDPGLLHLYYIKYKQEKTQLFTNLKQSQNGKFKQNDKSSIDKPGRKPRIKDIRSGESGSVSRTGE
jgi:hypothetical protein